MNRHEMRVSCKMALFNPDRSKVLLAKYGMNHYGLPGGHIEPSEEPDQAMAREISEEFGLEDVDAKLVHAWVHDNGKLILGYIATIDESVPIKVQEEELAGADWHLLSDIANGSVFVPSYKDFILRNA